jgi:serine/threonine-protein kinase
LPDPQSRLFDALTDRYRIERELGAGGMATVYLAQDLRHDRKVAIKVLRPELAAVIGAERFLREIKTIANLQHPHILGLIDSGEVNGTAYYVMPFVEGESLRDRLSRQKQLGIPEAVRIAVEVADALDYAHRHGVIHRDIKPENILLHDDRALVSDFGIALAVSTAGGTRMTETGMSLGTPHYMSPEQAMGEREISARSDVYALGCTLYEMLTGDPPFTGSTAQAIVAKVLTEAPRGLTAQRHTIPPHVEAAVLTALEKLPADRFATARELAEALEGKTVGAYEGRRPAPGRPAPQLAYRPAVPTVAVGLLLAVLALWGWLRHPSVTGGVSRQQVVLWQHALGRLLSPGVERLATQAAIAPDGSSIVFSDSIGGTLGLMRKLRNERNAVPVAGTEGGVSPFFSPDGKWIGYLTTDGKLRKVPVEGGGSITLAGDGNLTYHAAAWLDDGTIVYEGLNAIRRVSSEGGASRPAQGKTTDQFANVAHISPLPGSRGFLFTSCPGNCGIESSIYVSDFAADSSRLLIAHGAGAWFSPTGHLLYTDREGGLYAAGFDPRRLALTSGVVPVLEDVAPGNFALSASGSVLYTVKGGGNAASELMWVSRDGHAEPFDSAWHAQFEYPALSPDGKALAVSVRDGATHLWIRRSDGTRQKLTQSGTVNWRASWTPDGRSVAFVSNLRGGGGQDDYDIYQMPVDGSAPASLLLHHTFGLWEAELSRDGQWLVTRSDEEGASNIRGRRLRGDTTLVPLVINKGVSITVALSPDGRWLAYASDLTGRDEIYVTPFPNATSTHLVSRDGGTEPHWSHSGRELFFKGSGQLMAVEVAPGSAFQAGTPRPLFPLAGYRSARNRQQYDVAPDDRHFVMIRDPRDEAGAAVVYVDGWFEEFEAKVRAKR